MPVLLGLLSQLGRDVLDLPLGAQVLVEPDESLHVEEVDDALVVALGSDRELDHGDVGAQPLGDGVDGLEEVGTEPVHLVDEADPGYAVLVGLTPHRLCLRLDSRHAVEHGHRPVKHAQRPFDLDGEVDVTGCVDDVDVVRRATRRWLPLR